MNSRTKSAVLAGLAWALLSGTALSGGEAARVQVIRAPAWSQGDAVREGAEEFLILMEVARITHSPVQGGLVGVGDRRGLFGPGAEQALHAAALHGVPVVKLAPNGRVLPAPHGLFLDGGTLTEQEACVVLARCLARHGALPGVDVRADDTQLAGLRARLQLYQNELTLAAGTRVAAR